MPQVRLPIFNGGGDEFTGDAHAISAGTPNSWDPIQTFGWVGRLEKDANEVNAFFAFDLGNTGDPLDALNVPLGSVVNGTNFEFSETGGAIGVGNIRAAFVKLDGVWDVNGFARTGDRSSGPFYTLAWQFPNTGAALPHVTQDSSDVLEAEAVAGVWATGDIAIANFALHPSGDRYGIGDGTSGAPVNQFTETLVPTVFGALLNVNGDRYAAVTLDSMSVANAAIRMEPYFSEAGPSLAAELVIDFTYNNPTFTSVPVTTGTVLVAYSYDADADPYVLGDQTAGNFLDVVFGLDGVASSPSVDDPPAGMTIDAGTGVISWTPGAFQVGTHEITVRATNEGGIFSRQLYTITITKGSEGDLDVSGDLQVTAEDTLTADPVADAITAEPSAQTITAEPSAQTIAVEPQGGPLSVTVSPASIVVEPD